MLTTQPSMIGESASLMSPGTWCQPTNTAGAAELATAPVARYIRPSSSAAIRATAVAGSASITTFACRPAAGETTVTVSCMTVSLRRSGSIPQQKEQARRHGRSRSSRLLLERGGELGVGLGKRLHRRVQVLAHPVQALDHLGRPAVELRV